MQNSRQSEIELVFENKHVDLYKSKNLSPSVCVIKIISEKDEGTKEAEKKMKPNLITRND